jgi:hypothetical protein
MFTRVVGVWMLIVQGVVAFFVYNIGIPSDSEVAIVYAAVVAVWAYWAYHVVPKFIAMARGKQGL